jgi:hypothetical protein
VKNLLIISILLLSRLIGFGQEKKDSVFLIEGIVAEFDSVMIEPYDTVFINSVKIKVVADGITIVESSTNEKGEFNIYYPRDTHIKYRKVLEIYEHPDYIPIKSIIASPFNIDGPKKFYTTALMERKK